MPGTTLMVYKKGKSIKNPQTGAMLELPGKKVGFVNVDYSFGDDDFTEISFVTLVSGAISDDLQSYYLSNQWLVRS